MPWLLALLELLVVWELSRSRLLGEVDDLLLLVHTLGLNSVMTTVTLFTVTSLCMAVLLSTFLSLGLALGADFLSLSLASFSFRGLFGTGRGSTCGTSWGFSLGFLFGDLD